MDPAAISAKPAITTMWWIAPSREPRGEAKGTVSPSDIPITMSRTTSVEVKWCSVAA